MSSSRRIRRDDFDIESIEKFYDRGKHKSRSSGSRARSRSQKRSHTRRLENASRSRSRSIERKRSRRGRDSYSHSRSRSRSRDYSRRSDKRIRRYRDSRSKSCSRSMSRSRSRSQSNSCKYQGYRYPYRRDERRGSISRSRSRSSSQFRDFGIKSTKSGDQSPDKQTSSFTPALANVSENNKEYNATCDNLEDLPLPKQKSEEIYNFDEDEPIDRERIHKEMEEKLRAALAKEGKVYPPPKPEASHPVFANDGSFLEIFKKMQQAQASTSASSIAAPVNIAKSLPCVPPIVATANPTTAPYLAAAAIGKSAPPPPIVGRRRGGKILKTGVVAKPKIQTDGNADPKDFWSLYLAEVNKYKNTACESEQGNRPLVK